MGEGAAEEEEQGEGDVEAHEEDEEDSEEEHREAEEDSRHEDEEHRGDEVRREDGGDSKAHSIPPPHAAVLLYFALAFPLFPCFASPLATAVTSATPSRAARRACALSCTLLCRCRYLSLCSCAMSDKQHKLVSKMANRFRVSTFEFAAIQLACMHDYCNICAFESESSIAH